MKKIKTYLKFFS